MSRVIDLLSQKFGRWTVVGSASNTAGGQARWLCRCECGTERELPGQSLRSGRSMSCGCYKAESAGSRSRTHGMSKTVEYHCWGNMVSRATSTVRPDAALYSLRGITVCDRWRHSFEAFLADMGHRPSPQHSLDRINNDRGYEPDNCRWALPVVQQNNKRNNPVFLYSGKAVTVPQAWRIAGQVVSLSVVYSRLKRGWPLTACVEVPPVRCAGKRAKGSKHYE